MHLRSYKNCGEFPKKPVDSSGCAAVIGSSNHMTEEMVRDLLKDIYQLPTSRLRKEKVRSKEQGRYLWWFSQITHPNIYCKNYLWGGEGNIIGSLVSHPGILDDEFEELLAAEKLSKIWSWYNKLVMHVQTHIYHYITWIAF